MKLAEALSLRAELKNKINALGLRIGEVPIHESQTKIHDAADGSYTDYELFVSPTRDFEQELLWHGCKIIVLSPDDFRQEMIGILKDMARSYETGENTVEE